MAKRKRGSSGFPQPLKKLTEREEEIPGERVQRMLSAAAAIRSADGSGSAEDASVEVAKVRKSKPMPYFKLPNFTGKSPLADELAKLVAPSPGREVESFQTRGFQIVQVGQGHQVITWKKERMIHLKPNYALKQKKKQKYPLHWIKPKGYTYNEFKVCKPYLKWRTFEFGLPIPKKYKMLKRHMDQVRMTKGYGVTVHYPYNRGCLFTPHDTDFEKHHTLKVYMTNMVWALVSAMMREFKELKPAGLQLTNVVGCTGIWYFLLSHSFEPQKINRRNGLKEEQVEVDVVQSMFELTRGMFVENPQEPEHFNLLEWKLSKGSKLMYSSASTKGGEHEFKRLFVKSIPQC